MEERQQLNKTLKPHWVWAIAFGSAIGWGAFVLPVDWLSMAGPLGVIIGFSIGAVLMIIIGVSFSSLIEKLPVTGGGFAYAYYGLGRYHAFICGWFLTLGYVAIVALNASALALLGKFVFPRVVEQGYMYTIAGWEVYTGEVIVACAALTIFSLVNIRGASSSAFSQFVFCVCLFGGVLLLTIAMIIHPTSSFSNLQPLFQPGVGSIASIAAIIAIAPWAYIGFDNIPQAAEEFNFSPKKAFRIIVIALVFAALTYSMTVIATGIGQPWMEAVQAGSVWGTAMLVENAYGTIGVILLSFALIMGILTGLNGFYMSASRLLFAMGRAKVIPAVFGKLHRSHKTPYAGILFTLAFTLFAPFFGREALLWVVDMSALGVTIAYFYTCFIAYRLFKWSDSNNKRDNKRATVSPGRKFLCLLGILSSAGFLLLLIVPGSPGFLSTPSWIALLVWLGLGALFFLIKFKHIRALPKAELDHLILGDFKDKEESEFEDDLENVSS